MAIQFKHLENMQTHLKGQEHDKVFCPIHSLLVWIEHV